ncbi:SOS response-associated peptidase family protein [Mesorhizobium sp. M0203]|uniref:SOS response-associated peptidase family protein n=1 Tax=Mesorhizobium sp. M0203 TaxID=2956912 RepID=UPI00333B5051
MKAGEPFALAALWENWRDPAIGDNIRFTVLTCEPNPLMATFHNRVPVILAPEDYMTWLTEVIVFDYVDEMVQCWRAWQQNGERDIGRSAIGLSDPPPAAHRLKSSSVPVRRRSI